MLDAAKCVEDQQAGEEAAAAVKAAATVDKEAKKKQRYESKYAEEDRAGGRQCTRGYGWWAWRQHLGEDMSVEAMEILEQAYQRGVAKSVKRASYIMMENDLYEKISVELCYKRYRIQLWLAMRLKQT